MDNEEKYKIIKPFAESIISDGEDLSIEYAEIGVDLLMDNIFNDISDVFQEIPIVKTVRAIGKMGVSLKAMHTLKKQLVFIQTLQLGNPNTAEIEKRKKAFNNNEKWFYDEAEMLAVYIDRISETDKAKIIAKIYAGVLSGELKFNELRHYIEIVDRLFIEDIPQIISFYESFIDQEECKRRMQETTKDQHNRAYAISTVTDIIFCKRLESLGILYSDIQNNLSGQPNIEYSLSIYGQHLGKILKSLGYGRLRIS